MTNSSENLFAGALKAKAAGAAPETEAAGKEQTAAAAPATAPVVQTAPVTQDPPQVQTQQGDDNTIQQPTELDILKNRARLMGIQFGNNIGVDALKAKIQAKIDGNDQGASNDAGSNAGSGNGSGAGNDDDANQNGVQGAQPAETAKPKSLRQQQYEEQMRLVRLRITNLDPKKKDLPGEIITFSNRILGTVKKYIPFGEATEEGYHVPFCIYQILKAREFLNIRIKKVNGRPVVETGMVREFALEVLDPLTPKELAQLQANQAAAGGLD